MRPDHTPPCSTVPQVAQYAQRMTSTNAAAPSEQPERARLISGPRASIIIGAVGAVIALASLAEWTPDAYLYLRNALVAIAGLLVFFAALALRRSPDKTHADADRRRDIGAMIAALLVGGFWAFTYGAFGREINMVADLVTAIAYVTIGLLISAPSPVGVNGRFTGAAVIAAVCAAGVFVLWASESRLDGQRTMRECLLYAADEGEDDPIAFCRMINEEPDDSGGRFG